MASRALAAIPAGLLVLTLAPAAWGATYYVDNSLPASGKHDGKSWATAWLSPADVASVAPGDVVYISGGPKGSTQTYVGVKTPGSNGDDWHPAGGTAKNPVTYQIGQDDAHDGTVVFDGQGAMYFLGYPDYNDMTNVHDVVLSGEAKDNKRHFAIRNYGLPVHGDMAQNLRISYVDFGHCGDGPIRLIPSHGGIEIDHCYAYLAELDADHFSQGEFNGKGFDVDSAHDNEIYLPRAKDTGDGSDGFQWGGSGFSIIHNTIVAYEAAYTGGQHQDGIQTLGASYVKIAGNTIVGMSNSAIYLDGYGGDFEHVWVYDNLVIGGGVGIAAGPDSGALMGLGRWPNFTDVIITNNTTADTWNVEPGIALWIDPYIEQSQHVTVTTKFTDCVVSNNVVVNAAGYQIDKSITSQDNVTLGASDAKSEFSSYAPNAADNDFHLTEKSAELRGKGANLSKYSGADHDGNAWPATGAWDVGAYAYCGTDCAPPSGGAGGGAGEGGGGAGGSGGSNSSSGGCGCRIGADPSTDGLLLFGVGLALALARRAELRAAK
jgi:hypothetical protein